MRRTASPSRAADWASKGAAAEVSPATGEIAPESFFAPPSDKAPEGSKVSLREVPKAAPNEKLRVPIDPTNEIVIIAAAIASAEERKRLLAMFAPDDFHSKGHPEIWSAFGELERQRLAYDPATMRQLSGGVVDIDYLELLATQRPEVPPNLSHHIEKLRWDNVRVGAAKGPLMQLLDSLRDPSSSCA